MAPTVAPTRSAPTLHYGREPIDARAAARSPRRARRAGV